MGEAARGKNGISERIIIKMAENTVTHSFLGPIWGRGTDKRTS